MGRFANFDTVTNPGNQTDRTLGMTKKNKNSEATLGHIFCPGLERSGARSGRGADQIHAHSAAPFSFNISRTGEVLFPDRASRAHL